MCVFERESEREYTPWEGTVVVRLKQENCGEKTRGLNEREREREKENDGHL